MAWQEGDIGFFDDLDDVEDLDQEGDDEIDYMEGYDEIEYGEERIPRALEEYERMTRESED